MAQRKIKDQTLLKALKTVIDPELNINIVDLGLIYQAKRKGEKSAYIQMTLTTPGCPLAPVIDHLVHQALQEIHVTQVKLEITFDPPWTPQMMTKSAQAELNLL